MTRIALQLLDSAHGQPLQVWEFARAEVVRIGRGVDNDVALASPFVSRAHAVAQFDFESEDWLLSVISQQGVFVEGNRVDSMSLRSGAVFRLAAKGPYLRVAEPAHVEDDSDHHSTISVDSNVAPLLILDSQQRDRQVGEIASSDYFQNLQQLAEKLRRRNKSS